MSDKAIVVCVQERFGNSILAVQLAGITIGRILQDAPGEWVIIPEPKPLPRYPTMEAAVEKLLERAQTDSVDGTT